MEEIIQQILGYLRGMWHRRWFGLAAAWLVALVSVIAIYRIPEKYEASARVYVDTESLLGPLLSGLAIRPNVEQQVALISRTLISRPNIEKLIRMADLDLGVRSGRQQEELMDDVMRNIGLSGGANNLYVISYRDPNPDLTKRVVQSLLTIFVESSLGEKRADSRSAVKFIDQQIKRYENNLQAAENRLKAFKLKNMGVAGRDGQDYFGRLAQVRGQIESAKLEMEAAQQARDAYKKELAGETPTFMPEMEAAAEESLPELDARISALNRSQDELMLRYTDSHPDVQANKRLIEQLEQQKKTALEARRQANPSGRPRSTPPERNPMFQQLRLSLAEAEARVASARAKLGGYESQFRALLGQAKLVPEVEEEYMQLNRDYEVQKRTYEALLTRREAGEMGIEVQDVGGAQFRVIDPPRVSTQPVAPNRIGLLAMALVGSLVAGLFVSLAVSQLMPIFHDSRTLREVSKRPILGMVSMLPSEALKRLKRRKALLFAGGVGSLLGAFAGVFAFALVVGRVI